jgi:hypothetical protein
MVNLIQRIERGGRRIARRIATGGEEALGDIEMATREVAEVAEEEAAPLLEEAAEVGVEALAPEIAVGVAVGGTLATTSYARRVLDLIGAKKRKKSERDSQSSAQAPQEPGSRRTPRRAVRPGQSPPPPPPAPMPPRGVSKSTHWYDRTRKKWIKRKRPLKKRPSMRKKVYKKRTGAKKRTYKKKTVKRKYMRSLGSTKYETHGIISRHDVSYFGFAANGGRDEFLHAACDGILRAWAGKFHIAIPTPDSDWYSGPTGSPQPLSYQVSYRKKRYHAGATAGTAENGTRRDLTGIAHHTMVDELTKEFILKARDGKMPYYVKIFTTTTAANGSERLYTDPKFGDMLLNVTSTMKVKLRNITNNDGAGSVNITNPATRNPLEGYAYEFRGEIPIVKEALFNTDEAFYCKFHHRDNKRGVCFGPQAGVWADGNAEITEAEGRDDDDGMDAAETNTVATQTAGPMAKGKFLSTPPIASKVFSNCAKQHKIVMPVAREVTHTLKASYKGTVAGLMEKYNDDKYRLSSIGTSMWLCLRQKFRQNNTLTADGIRQTDDHDDVTVEYDTSTVLRAGARFARPETTPAEVKQLEFNSIDEAQQ